LLAASLLGACSLLFDPAELKLRSYPSRRNQIVGQADALWVSFSRAPERLAAEQNLWVSSIRGRAEGDLHWSGDRLRFIPVPALSPGLRYVLHYEGEVQGAGGGSYSADLTVPFYVESRAEPPRLRSVSPADGVVAGVETPLRLRFDTPMDPESVEQAMTLLPASSVACSWNEEQTEAVFVPGNGWTLLTHYRWKLAPQAKSRDGLLLPRAREGSFFTGEDATPPRIIRTVPAVESDGTYLELSGLGYRDALLIECSEAIDQHSLTRSVSISPHIPGTFTAVSATTAAFLPATGWTMDTVYQLEIGTGLHDTAGNRMLYPYSTTVRPDIPLQRITSIFVDWDEGSVEFGEPQFNTFAPLTVGVLEVAGELTNHVEIRFAEPIDAAKADALAGAVSLAPYFPKSIEGLPVIESLSWLNSTTLSLTFTGYDRPTSTEDSVERWLYKLVVPGGSELSLNTHGSFLKEETWILLHMPPAP
jgi:hypothetical protein